MIDTIGVGNDVNVQRLNRRVMVNLLTMTYKYNIKNTPNRNLDFNDIFYSNIIFL